MRLQQYIITIILLSYWYGLTAFSENKEKAGIRVLQSNQKELLIEFIPDYQPEMSLETKSGKAIQFDFSGAVSFPGLKPGEPELLVRSIPVRLSGAKGARVEIISSEFETIQNVLLAPVPMPKNSEAGPEDEMVINSDSYAINGFLPAQVASIENIGEVRGSILGQVFFAPVRYNPATSTIEKYSRIVAKVFLGEAEPGRRFSDDLVNDIALNDEVFQDAYNASVAGTASILQNSLLSSGIWFKFPISENGIYKVTGATMLAAGIPSSTDPMVIRMFNNGGLELPVSTATPYIQDLLEIAVQTFDAGNNHRLDADDYILFYGKGVRGWKYNPQTKSYSHYLNHFSESNIYWLNVGATNAKQMASLPFSSSPANYFPASVSGHIYREDEKINVTNSGLEWLGQPFNVGDIITYSHSLPGLDFSRKILYRFRVGAQSKGFSTFSINEHADLLLTTPSIYPTDIIHYGSYFVRTAPDVIEVNTFPHFSDEQSLLRFTFNSTNVDGTGFIDWYEIHYRRFPRAQNNVVSFFTDDTTAATHYSLPGFTTNKVYVFDVTRFDSVLVNQDPGLNVDTCVFSLPLTSGSSREIIVSGMSAVQQVGSLTQVENQNLQGDTTFATEIIITNQAFLSAAQRLKAHRERAGEDYVRTSIVDVNQIYNEFGGGIPGPYAIRNYLRYCYEHWQTPPKYALLLGDGDFDYRGIINPRNTKIPVWETGVEWDPILSYATDDDFVIFNTSRRVSMGVGRIPCQTVQEANASIDKIIEYETVPVRDPWKLRVTLVADDGKTSDGTDRFLHAGDMESLSNYIPSLFEKRKIFLHEYPTVFTPNGRRKPDVNKAIRDQINDGTSVLSFAGHGNPRLWTHEAVFVRETDLPLLSNKGKYFFLVAATCNYGAMDMMTEQSSAELLALMPQAGAIATYSATRPVYAFRNYDLSVGLYQELFKTTTGNQISPQRLGDVIFRMRQNFSDANDRKYILLGDPATRICFPPMYASIDSLNGESLTQPVQLRALSKSTLSAGVRDTNFILQNGFSGSAEVVVNDANRLVEINDPEDGRFTYKTTGNVIFRGQASISNGIMNSQFIVPKDISYSNDFGRVLVYFSNSSTDGAGYTTNVRIGGTDTTAESDAEGPAMQLYIDRKTFRSGDVVGANPLLIAEFEDEHGINTSGAGIGHRIEAWLDDNAQSIDLTDYYKSNANTFQQGAVQYSLGALTEGSHKIRVRAWDTYNNSSMTETVFDVMTGVGLKLNNVFNYPNPFSSTTIFTAEHNQVGIIDAEVKIYTVAGRLIQTLGVNSVNDRYIKIPWDGHDRDGDEIANGIYLYKFVVKTPDGRLSGEALGKLSILK